MFSVMVVHLWLDVSKYRLHLIRVYSVNICLWLYAYWFYFHYHVGQGRFRYGVCI